eukprot:m.225524 g.225524  ORF g.225524 m.225524 type:complete len:1472 (+) comp17310_c0_seq1:157-4572(+)
MAASLDPNVVPGTTFLVDCFKDKRKIKSATTYFLTHYHADHYGGLNEKWQAGPIYCSPATAKLVIEFLEVDPKYIHSLDFDAPHRIGNATVTLMDANHCPGAAMLLFSVTTDGTTRHHLHTGDCRYTPSMLDHPALQGVHIDNLYLDTTYGDAKYVFPEQTETVEFIARTIAHELEINKGRTLVLVATYSIGKEKILLRTHGLTGCKIEVTDRKLRMLRHCNLPVDLDAVFTTEHLGSSVRIVGWHELGDMAQGGWAFLPAYPRLHEMLDHYSAQFDRLVAFYPTGWTYTIAKAIKQQQTRTVDKRSSRAEANADTPTTDPTASNTQPMATDSMDTGLDDEDAVDDNTAMSLAPSSHLQARPSILYVSETKNKVTVYTVPYSEHSSFAELRAFVGGVRPTNVIPTVVVGSRNTSSVTRLRKLTGLFEDLVDRTKAAASFVAMMQAPRSLRRASSQATGDSFEIASKSTSNCEMVDKTGEEGNQSTEAFLSCPACHQKVASKAINRHLDTCLNQPITRSRREATADINVEDADNDDRGDKVDERNDIEIVEISSAISRAGQPQATDDGGDNVELDLKLERDSVSGTDSTLWTTRKGQTQTRCLSKKQALLIDAIGPQLTASQASLLLQHCQSDVQRAINHYFDKGLVEPRVTRRQSAKQQSTTTNRTGVLAVRSEEGSTSSRPSPKRTQKVAAGKQSTLFNYFASPTKPKETKCKAPSPQSKTETAKARPESNLPSPLCLPDPSQAGQVVSAADALTAPRKSHKASSTPVDDPRDPPYRLLADVLLQLTETNSRLRIVALLAEVFANVYRLTIDETGKADPDALIAAVYLTTNTLAPSYKGVELGIGEKLVASVVAEVSGRSAARMREDYKETGDLGDVAARALRSQKTLFKPKPLTIKGVFRSLHTIASQKGKGSQALKRSIVHKLILACDGPEARFIVRTLIANLRTGAVGLVVHTSIGHAMVDVLQSPMPNEEAAQLIKDTYAQHPCWNSILNALVAGGFEQMQHDCGPSVGIPVQPMLGKITRSLNDVMKQLHGRDYQAEFKYDGCRGQIHIQQSVKDEVPKCFMFSRHLEDMSTRYPDGLSAVLEAGRVTADSPALRFRSCVLDAEIVAVDNTGKILPFQTLMNRARKDVEASEVTISVQIFLFDMMMLNDKSLIKLPLRHRCQLMQRCFVPIPNRLDFVACTQFTADGDEEHDPEALKAVLLQAIDTKCEGLMVKALGPDLGAATIDNDDNSIEAIDALTIELVGLAQQIEERYQLKVDAAMTKAKASKTKKSAKATAKAAAQSVEDPLALSTYQPSKRCENWLKVKKDYIEGLGDSLDLVVIGAWWGNGRKATWFSPFLLACYNPDTEELESVCKVMSGFTDEFYKKMTAKFKQPEHQCSKKAYYNVSDGMTPSLWLEPLEVWEIRGADLTVSPVHRAAAGCIPDRPDAGVSLRFPRFIRKRPDKTFEEATTSHQIASMYHQQFS